MFVLPRGQDKDGTIPMYTHYFKCSVCPEKFERDYPDATLRKPAADDNKCWQWQRAKGLEGRAQKGCTGVVRWDGWDRKPTLKVAAVVVDPVTQMRNTYRNPNFDVQRFSAIPVAYQAAVRLIIGQANGAAYAAAPGNFDRGSHVTDPRGQKGGFPASSETREYHLTAGKKGRMTRARYGGVYAFYYSPTHNVAANNYEYCLIVDDNDHPYLRGGGVQLAQP